MEIDRSVICCLSEESIRSRLKSDLYCPSRRKSCSPSFKVEQVIAGLVILKVYVQPLGAEWPVPLQTAPIQIELRVPLEPHIGSAGILPRVVIESGLQADANPEVSRALGVVGQPFFSLAKVLPGRVAV